MVDVKLDEAEVKRAIAKVNALGNVTRRQRKAALRKAAIIIRDTARSNVPVADQVVKRYSTPKLDGKLKAPKRQFLPLIFIDALFIFIGFAWQFCFSFSTLAIFLIE